MSLLTKYASFISPAAGRVLTGAALGGVVGGLGGAALDRENRGRGALLGGAGGALLGAGAGHLTSRTVRKAVDQTSAPFGTLLHRNHPWNAAGPAADIRALADQLPNLAEEPINKAHTEFLKDLAEATTAAAAQEPHARVAELLSRLKPGPKIQIDLRYPGKST